MEDDISHTRTSGSRRPNNRGGALSGAAVGGVIGGLAGGTGALARIGIPEHDRARVEQKIGAGAILIAVGSDEPARLDRAFRVFKSSGAEEVYWAEDLAA